MGTTRYNTKDATSIFAYSKGLLHKSLAEAVKEINPLIDVNEIDFKGKGGLGQLVEKFYYGYEPNSSPLPDFPEAGVELKTTPLKKDAKENYLIKERLVCDMIDFCEIVKYSFEESPFYKKSLLMLIIFYLHVKRKGEASQRFRVYLQCIVDIKGQGFSYYQTRLRSNHKQDKTRQGSRTLRRRHNVSCRM